MRSRVRLRTAASAAAGDRRSPVRARAPRAAGGRSACRTGGSRGRRPPARGPITVGNGHGAPQSSNGPMLCSALRCAETGRGCNAACSHRPPAPSERAAMFQSLRVSCALSSSEDSISLEISTGEDRSRFQNVHTTLSSRNRNSLCLRIAQNSGPRLSSGILFHFTRCSALDFWEHATPGFSLTFEAANLITFVVPVQVAALVLQIVEWLMMLLLCRGLR